MTNRNDEAVGLLRTGVIKGYDPNTGKMQVELHYAPNMSSNSPIEIYASFGMFYNNGIFMGTLPENETPVVVGSGSDEKWYFVSFLARNVNYVPQLESGKLLITNNGINKITLGKDADILIGTDNNRIHLDTDDSLFSVNFQDEYHFTQATRQINGILRRDLRPNECFSQCLKLESDKYQHEYRIIGLDPSATTNIASGSAKNPPFVEQREMVYEFQYYANVSDDLYESSLYTDKDPPPPKYNFLNRRKSRSDTLSLTLASPNYLMETIKGTVVDIFGNILDLNRLPLPIGKDQNTIKGTDKAQSFLKIKELERKSIAYHFELNARKDLSVKNAGTSTGALLGIDSNSDYARNRSRFFVDVDKEGQFKINVPASSEKGNVPLLTRYENYSSFTGDNPDVLEQNKDNIDIYLDSFAAPHVPRNSNESIPLDSSNRGSITLKNGDAIATPQDRIAKQPIKHGTAHHDILNTCFMHSQIMFLEYDYDYPNYKNIDIQKITDYNNRTDKADLNNIVTSSIKTSGTEANAGGRSGMINLDGSLEFNIGANTIDRQSLWLDTAGGIIANIGRDIKGRSFGMNLDGDVFIQLGGVGVSTDSRFNGPQNAKRAAVLDIRVMNSLGNQVTMIRIDETGIQIMTPSKLQIHATNEIKITSNDVIDIESEILLLQGRQVIKGDRTSGTPSI